MRLHLRIATVAVIFFLGVARPLWAHPLGNFTINHLTRLTITGSRVEVVYVLDMAEIPTYQVIQEATPQGSVSRHRLAMWAQSEAATLLGQLQLVVAAVRQPLRLDTAAARLRPGAGGLPTLYLVIRAHAVLPTVPFGRSIAYQDQTFPRRLGWRDVVIAPASEPTHELTAYPTVTIASPRATTAVALDEDRAGTVTIRASSDVDGSPHNIPALSVMRSNMLSDMLARGTGDRTFVLLTILVAVALGALHALEPGHGKTLLAVSLVGARATVKQAALLAAGLTLAHTAGVVALGIAINVLRGYFVPEAIYSWITLGSGILIAVIGARSVRERLQAHQPRPHTHGRAEHAHTHARAEHAHRNDAHAHSHSAAGTSLSFGAILGAAVSGGVAPCPAALVVLLAAVALNEVFYGICVVIAFSFGLATTLAGLGIAVVRGASLLQRGPRFDRVIAVGPFVSAIFIALIGALLIGQGSVESGIASAPLGVTLVVAIAIAGYALSHAAHRHAGVA